MVCKIVAGTAAGYLLGRGLAWVMFHMPNRAKLSRTGAGFVALGITLLVYGATELVGDYGFLVVFVAALAVRASILATMSKLKLYGSFGGPSGRNGHSVSCTGSRAITGWSSAVVQPRLADLERAGQPRSGPRWVQARGRQRNPPCNRPTQRRFTIHMDGGRMEEDGGECARAAAQVGR